VICIVILVKKNYFETEVVFGYKIFLF